jgi:hypothetical protein
MAPALSSSITRRWRTHAGAGALALLLALTGTSAALGAPGGTGGTGGPGTSGASGPADDGPVTLDGHFNFEEQTGTEPSGDWSFEAADCQGEGAVAIDSEVAHGGTKSLRVDGAAGYCNHAFASLNLEGNYPEGNIVYFRFWVRHTTPLPAQHTTFVALEDGSTPDGTDLRMGGQNEVLQWNREADDATLPEQSPAGVALSEPLPVDEWTCVEFSIDTGWGDVETWVNGRSQPIEGLVADETPTPDVDEQWLAADSQPPLPLDLRLGWESYGEGADTLWFDDVAYGARRLWCR